MEAFLSSIPSKAPKISDVSEEEDDFKHSESEADEAETESSSDSVPCDCTALCYSKIVNAFQPIDKRIL